MCPRLSDVHCGFGVVPRLLRILEFHRFVGSLQGFNYRDRDRCCSRASAVAVDGGLESNVEWRCHGSEGLNLSEQGVRQISPAAPSPVAVEELGRHRRDDRLVISFWGASPKQT